MADYRVRFLNDLADCYGRIHRVCQREIRVSTALGADEAIAAAKREFARQEGVADWSLRARLIEFDQAVELAMDGAER